MTLNRYWYTQMIEMHVGAIGVDKISGEPIILLSDAENKRTLPIWVGAIEARAISLAVSKITSPRPLTHDLLLSLIKQIGYRLKEVQIDEMEGQTYKALIVLVKENGIGHESVLSLDARPSDAIALATSVGAPVLVGERIFNRATLMLTDSKSSKEARAKIEKDDASFAKFLQDLKASDFNSFCPEDPDDSLDDVSEEGT